MRRLWQTTKNLNFKASVEKTAADMVKKTSNGAYSVQTYWIETAPTQAVKAAGERILEGALNHPLMA